MNGLFKQEMLDLGMEVEMDNKLKAFGQGIILSHKLKDIVKELNDLPSTCCLHAFQYFTCRFT